MKRVICLLASALFFLSVVNAHAAPVRQRVPVRFHSHRELTQYVAALNWMSKWTGFGITYTTRVARGAPRIVETDSSLGADRDEVVCRGPGGAAIAITGTITASDAGIGGIADAAATVGSTGSLNAKARLITTQLNGGLPVALGQGTMAQSLRVVLPSDQSSLPVTPAATESHLGAVGGDLVTISSTWTRPTDTSPESANEVVSDSTSATTMQPLAGAVRVTSGSAYIVGIRLSTNLKSITPRWRVHFFNTTGATISADNASWQDKYADAAKRIGFWDLPAMTTGADTSNSDMSRTADLNTRIPFTCSNGGTSIYYVLEVLDTIGSATSGQSYTLTVLIDRN